MSTDPKILEDLWRKLEPEIERQRAEAREESAPEQPITAADILQAGLDHMKDRAATYDKPEGERSMAATVKAFEAITGIGMSETNGWIFMLVLKAVRSRQGGYRADNFEDAAAYSGLAGEAAARERGGQDE